MYTQIDFFSDFNVSIYSINQQLPIKNVYVDCLIKYCYIIEVFPSSYAIYQTVK